MTLGVSGVPVPPDGNYWLASCQTGSGGNNENEHDQQRSDSLSPRVRFDGDEVCALLG